MNQKSVLQITAEVWQTIISHLQAIYPEEGCGLLFASPGQPATTVCIVENILHNSTTYKMHSGQLVEAMLVQEAIGQELVAIFHSHPAGPAYPSTTDQANWYYPTVAMLIIGWPPAGRAFYLANHKICEVTCQIV